MLKLDGELELDVLPTTDESDGVRLVIWKKQDPKWFETLAKEKAVARARAYWRLASAAAKRGADGVVVQVAGLTLTVPISLLKTYAHEISTLARSGLACLDCIENVA
jgi:hypothetical protein